MIKTKPGAVGAAGAAADPAASARAGPAGDGRRERGLFINNPIETRDVSNPIETNSY